MWWLELAKSGIDSLAKAALGAGGFGVAFLLRKRTKLPQDELQEAEEKHAANSLDTRWRDYADQVETRLGALIERLQDQIDESARKIADDSRRIARLERLERMHFAYHFQLRGQVTDLGGVPADWPREIDPRGEA